ncbi:MAG: 4-alpha-glucanotransferase, partial [Chloroflexota bacterium]
MDLFPRSSGILLHPTSLPGRYGIGDLGEQAYQFVDWLAAARQSFWQVLPLGPTGYGDSPYQTHSAFAGNAALISLDMLVEDGWLAATDLSDAPVFPDSYVDFGMVIPYHNNLLDLAFANFGERATDNQIEAFSAWCADNAYWLDDYALFMALKEEHEGRPWVEWSAEEALRDALTRHEERINQYRFRQWL